MKTYNQYQNELNKAQAKMNLLDKLVDNGITKKSSGFFMRINVDSGYSMGENTYLMVGGLPLDAVDTTKEYAKSCKWRENHGKVVINFTKKDLKTYVAMCEEMDKLRMYGKKMESMHKETEIKNWVESKINMDLSVFSRGKVGSVYIWSIDRD